MFEKVHIAEIPINFNEEDLKGLGCEGCRTGEFLDFDFSMAFQPIVDVSEKTVFAYEALVRGLNQEPAFEVISKVTEKNIYRFDQTCRVKAIAMAAEKKLTKRLNINFLPGAVYRPEICIKTTLLAAERYGFPAERITFEVVETEMVEDAGHLHSIIQHYKEMGFSTALDDFGTGYSNLVSLADLFPNTVKVDLELVRGLDNDRRRQAIVAAIANLARDLGIEVVAEGVETPQTRDTLAEMGIVKQQGFLFGKPAFETFEEVDPSLFG